MSPAGARREPLTPEGQTLLAARVGSGDRAAEEELACLFQGRVLMMVRSRVRDAETARDLSQEVLLAVVLALRKGQLREGGRLSAFVYGTARNVVNGFFRSRRPEAMPLFAEAVVGDGGDMVQRLHARSLVDRLVKGLDPADRRILNLTLLEGLKPGEVAKRLGLSSEVVRARKSRAIKRALSILQVAERSGAPPEGES